MTDTTDDTPELDCEGADVTRRTIEPGEVFPPASRAIAEQMLRALAPIITANAAGDSTDGPVLFGAIMVMLASALITGAPNAEMLRNAEGYCHMILRNSVAQALDGDLPIGPRNRQ